MEIQTFGLIFVAGYFSVFLLGFQSRLVNYDNYKMAALNSFVISQAQVLLWGTLFHNLNWQAGIAHGLAGAAGITTSMWVHSKWFKKKETQTNDQPQDPDPRPRPAR